MSIAKIMSTRLVTVKLDDTLLQVKAIFEKAHFHHLLVVEEGKLLGVISDRDLFKALSPRLGTAAETSKDLASLNKKVHQIMSRELVSIDQQADVFSAIQMFNLHKISCLPVVDGKGNAVGIVSWRDILKLIEMYQNKKLKQRG